MMTPPSGPPISRFRFVQQAENALAVHFAQGDPNGIPTVPWQLVGTIQPVYLHPHRLPVWTALTTDGRQVVETLMGVHVTSWASQQQAAEALQRATGR